MTDVQRNETSNTDFLEHALSRMFSDPQARSMLDRRRQRAANTERKPQPSSAERNAQTAAKIAADELKLARPKKPARTLTRTRKPKAIVPDSAVRYEGTIKCIRPTKDDANVSFAFIDCEKFGRDVFVPPKLVQKHELQEGMKVPFRCEVQDEDRLRCLEIL